MTVSYSDKILTANRLGSFTRLLFYWRGSVYKLIWLELLIYLCAYFFISVIYRFCLQDDDQKRTFEEVSMFCEKHSPLIPLTFVLAFYVSAVVTRYWDQWNSIPWPDGVAFKINSYCSGLDDHTRLVRRTVTRYACLAIVETLRMVSSPVKKRFPTYGHLKEAGLLTEDEMQAILSAQSKSDFLNHVYWVPLSWASSLTVKAFEQGFIAKARYVSDVNEELSKLRTSCGTIICYDWVSLPLVYTQVVSLAVYSFFCASLLGRQWLDPDRVDVTQVDYVFPFFTVLQFLFYVGWLKVAEALLNPYGEDDEDFDTNWMVDRHLQWSYMMVDYVGQHPPKLEKDDHWDMCIPDELPYTVASLPFRVCPTVENCAAEKLNVPIAEQQPIFPQYLNTNDSTRGAGSTWRLNMAFNNINNIMTPMVRQRGRKDSQTPSTKSMPNNSNLDYKRKLTTISLSPRIDRKFNTKSRSPSYDKMEIISIGTEEMEKDEIRKISTSSKPSLSPVNEENNVLPIIVRTSPPRE